MPVSFQVERKTQGLDEIGLRDPWLRILCPAHACVPVHPCIQGLFTEMGEGHAPAASDPPQGKAEFFRQQDAKGLPQG